MIDIAIVFLYLAILLGVGIMQRSTRSGFKDFARVRDNTKKSSLILVATIFASSIGGGTTFGISEKAFAGNIAHSYGLLLAIPVDLMIAAFIIPRLIKHYGAETSGDVMAYYYGKTGRYMTGFSAILVSIGLVAAQISVSGRIFQYILQLDYVHGVILSYGIVIIYSTIGGFRSVLFANLLQFFAILVAIPIVSIFSLREIGFTEFISALPTEKISLSNSDLLMTTIAATLGFTVMNLFPNFIQRAMINRDAESTKKAIYVKSFIYGIFLIFITLNGLLAFELFPDQPPSLALPVLIDHIIPVGLQGFVIVGLLAAVMSTADSDLNVTSISLVKDFFGPIFRIDNQNRLLTITRIANVLIGSVAILIALCFNSVVDLVIFISGFWGPVILVPLISALYRKQNSPRQMLFASISGAVAFLVWEGYFANETSFKGVFIGTMVNLAMHMLFRMKKL